MVTLDTDCADEYDTVFGIYNVTDFEFDDRKYRLELRVR